MNDAILAFGPFVLAAGGACWVVHVVSGGALARWFGNLLRRAQTLVSPSANRLRKIRLQRDAAHRRFMELQNYRDECESQAMEWPEDSADRTELLAYAEAARVQAEEAYQKWHFLERSYRSERFERVVGA